MAGQTKRELFYDQWRLNMPMLVFPDEGGLWLVFRWEGQPQHAVCAPEKEMLVSRLRCSPLQQGLMLISVELEQPPESDSKSP